jgi:phosphatidylglycerophosphate synthase
MTAGERWSEELLVQLRAARYTPSAWVSFFACTFARARETRAQRRREHHQTLALGAAGLLTWGLVAAAGQAWIALAGALWWLLIALMLDWHLGMLEDATGRRLDGLGLANVLSILRAGVVPVLVVASPTVLVAVLVPAGITDGIDGRVARARGEESRLGHRLDGGVDGLVLSAAAIGAARAGVLPWWVAALVLARHALQWILLAASFFVRATAPPPHSLVSAKKPGLVLFAGLVLVALHITGAAVLVAAGALAGLATLGLTIARSRPAGAAR